MKRKKALITSGKRKKAIAMAVLKPGTGKIRINSVPLDLMEPNYVKMRVKEAVIIAGDSANQFDISVSVKGGGVWGQADAVRTAIANAFATNNNKLKEMYMAYDRSLIISDARRTEPHKPSRSKDGPRASKQQSKR
jgi:small subunit ribosomal protein S9